MTDSNLTNVLDAMGGKQFPGGCVDCDAFQEVIPVEAGVWSLAIFHDDDCPALARMERGK